MHVAAYFAPAWAAGGPARSMLTMCQAQRAAGLEVEVFTTTANGDSELPAHPEGVVHDGVPVRYFPLSHPQWVFGALSMRRPLAAALARADVAHLHGMFNATIWMASRLARAAGAPYVLSPRGMMHDAALRHHRWRKRAAWHLFDRAALDGAMVWHATSRAEAAALKQYGSGARLIEIPNAVALPEPAAAAAAEPFVLFLGRLHPIKRLDLLVRAFARVVRDVPAAHLVIAGPDEGGTRATIEPICAPFADRVRWIGAVDGRAKQALLMEAAALVLCSDSESFGMSAAEAMAAGTPVVVTRTCPWEAVEHERAGFWVDHNEEAIAAAVTTLLRDSTLARQMGERGQAFIRRTFAPAAVAEQWVRTYVRMTAAAGRAAPAPPVSGDVRDLHDSA